MYLILPPYILARTGAGFTVSWDVLSYETRNVSVNFIGGIVTRNAMKPLSVVWGPIFANFKATHFFGMRGEEHKCSV